MNRAELESVLVGIPLPASKGDLVDYARRQPGGGPAVPLLGKIADRSYESLDEVGEQVQRFQPRRADDTPLPQVESDAPPGGPAYVGEEVEPMNVVAARSV